MTLATSATTCSAGRTAGSAEDSASDGAMLSSRTIARVSSSTRTSLFSQTDCGVIRIRRLRWSDQRLPRRRSRNRRKRARSTRRRSRWRGSRSPLPARGSRCRDSLASCRRQIKRLTARHRSWRGDMRSLSARHPRCRRSHERLAGRRSRYPRRPFAAHVQG
jgi:hypothetical protein